MEIDPTDTDVKLFLKAARKGAGNYVRAFLNDGMDPNVQDIAGWTALKFAATDGNLRLVELLLDRGADFSIGDDYDTTPLMAATIFGHLDVVALLLERGDNPNSQNDSMFTPLMYASRQCERNYTEIAKLLLENGADPNLMDQIGITPLMFASMNQCNNTVKLLLEWGANPDIEDDYGKMALDHAHHPDPTTYELINNHINEEKLLTARQNLAFSKFMNEHLGKDSIIDKYLNIDYKNAMPKLFKRPEDDFFQRMHRQSEVVDMKRRMHEEKKRQRLIEEMENTRMADYLHDLDLDQYGSGFKSRKLTRKRRNKIFI
tara:strand:+ start:306 stop:1256 length:951 start_codon:yes stop_codon:yes gene_type:complete